VKAACCFNKKCEDRL